MPEYERFADDLRRHLQNNREEVVKFLGLGDRRPGNDQEWDRTHVAYNSMIQDVANQLLRDINWHRLFITAVGRHMRHLRQLGKPIEREDVVCAICLQMAAVDMEPGEGLSLQRLRREREIPEKPPPEQAP